MSIKGKIIKIEKNIAELEIIADDTCSKCGGCFNGMKKNNKFMSNALLPDDFKVEINDTVNIVPTENYNEAISSLLLFGLPLFGFVSSLITMQYIFEKSNPYSEIYSFVISVVISFVFLLPAIFYSRKLTKKHLTKPEFRITDKEEQNCKSSKKIPQI